MDEKNNTRHEYHTAWHPLLVFTIEHFAPANRKVLPEYHLNRLPQRVDIVVIEQENVPAAPVRKLRSIFDYARKRTLIEYKGVTDDLEPSDVFVLLGYACQYMAMHEVSDLHEMCLMVVADRIPKTFVARIEEMGGTFVSAENGLWQGELAGLSLHGVELREAYKTGPSEWFLGLFTRGFLQNPRDPRFTEGLDTEDLRLYALLRQHVQQLRRDPATMHLKDIDIAEESFNEVLKKIAACMPVEDRLEGLTLEQRFAGLTLEQRFAGLTPEQRLAGLTVEQLVDALSPEMLEGLARKAKR
jgi:hypothetical protein